jgi:hypothetical protein
MQEHVQGQVSSVQGCSSFIAKNFKPASFPFLFGVMYDATALWSEVLGQV